MDDHILTQINEVGNSFIKDQKGHFSTVSQILENSLIFVMEKRAEFGENDQDKVSRLQILSMNSMKNSSPYLKRDLESTSSVDKLLERINKLEERVFTNKASTDILSHTVPQALTEIHKLKEFVATTTETLEQFKCLEERMKEFDSEAEIAMIKSNMVLIDEDIEELKLRFESFLRVFTASKTENVKHFINFDRRMSDVESKGFTTEGSHRSTLEDEGTAANNQERKLSLAEKIHLTVAERCNSVIVEKETDTEDVFSQTQTENSRN
ncbi:hypothetical protein Btru_003415 [Bulinus truncatus]|nr:hypothetical protein Btru_003415 [Bulinus truncatus]